MSTDSWKGFSADRTSPSPGGTGGGFRCLRSRDVRWPRWPGMARVLEPATSSQSADVTCRVNLRLASLPNPLRDETWRNVQTFPSSGPEACVDIILLLPKKIIPEYCDLVYTKKKLNLLCFLKVLNI